MFELMFHENYRLGSGTRLGFLDESNRVESQSVSISPNFDLLAIDSQRSQLVRPHQQTLAKRLKGILEGQDLLACHASAEIADHLILVCPSVGVLGNEGPYQ